MFSCALWYSEFLYCCSTDFVDPYCGCWPDIFHSLSQSHCKWGNHSNFQEWIWFNSSKSMFSICSVMKSCIRIPLLQATDPYEMLLYKYTHYQPLSTKQIISFLSRWSALNDKHRRNNTVICWFKVWEVDSQFTETAVIVSLPRTDFLTSDKGMLLMEFALKFLISRYRMDT